MIIEDLAGMVQRGFEQTATDMNIIRQELHETREVLVNAIKDLEMRMLAYIAFTKEEIDRLKAWMESIEERVAFLEQKYKYKK